MRIEFHRGKVGPYLIVGRWELGLGGRSRTLHDSSVPGPGVLDPFLPRRLELTAHHVVHGRHLAPQLDRLWTLDVGARSLYLSRVKARP